VTAPTPIVAGEGGIRVADATPADPYDAIDAGPSPRTPIAPIIDAGPASLTKHKADPSWMSPAPAPAAPPSADAPTDPYTEAAPAAPVVTPTVLSRSELNVALADFGKLTNVLRGGFT